jgi:carbonic anhydrase/acetyltransferase-like protein (isoleucine patch superfamily)
VNGPLLLPYKGARPRVAASAFVAPGVALIGDVEVGEEASIWFGCVLRGDVSHIRVGARTNIQDGTVVHTSTDGPTLIGDDVTIAHMCLLHACVIESESLIGMGAVVMDHAHVESGGWVGAGAMVTERKQIRAGELWLGRPARMTRHVSDKERERIAALARRYVERGREYRAMLGLG